MRGWLVGLLAGGGVAAVAYWRRALTLDGAVAAALVGGVVFARGGLPAAAALLAFFGSSSALSRMGEGRKREAPRAQGKGSRRDAWQVLANGGVATACIAFGGGTRGRSGFVGALAAAGADTWATELGMLARRRPRLITTLRVVEPGTSGGITPEGLAASLGGATVVGLAWACLRGGWWGAVIAMVAGTFGSVVDSLLGATIQAVYRCPRCGARIEEPVHVACGQPADLVRGLRWATNDAINALATLSGAAVGLACER